ncbi:MAG: nucleotidyltransferase domain-containing protein [Defluviitaleaceae bacterium]|nr:nucleotidyltransferase domain-containing protein [Defluviitaleaceae bacterium]
MLSISDIKNKLTPIFENNGIKKAILFGSYATGEATEDSDIDLLIDDEGLIRGFRFFGVRCELEDAIDCQIDLIVARSVIPNSLIDIEIQQKGKIIYEKSH